MQQEYRSLRGLDTPLTVEDRLNDVSELAYQERGKATNEKALFAAGAVAVTTMLGVGMVLFATTLGIGTDVDAATYLMAARDILMGKGVTLQALEPGHFVPMTGFPPFLPMTIAAVGYFGTNLMSAARWLNALLFGVNILLAAHITRRCTGSATAALCAALITATTVNVLETHATLYSEPLFFTGVLCGFILMLDYVKSPSVLRLCLFSATFGAAAAARYVGVCLLPVGLAAIWLGYTDSRRRLNHLAAYVAIFGAPLAVWVARNLVDVHAFSNRIFAVHPPGAGHYVFTFISLSAFLLPGLVPAIIRMLFLAGAIWFIVRPLSISRGAKETNPEIRIFRRLAGIFLASYFLVFIVAETFFDAQIWMGGRHLMAVYLIAAMLGVCQGYEALGSASKHQRIAMVSALIALLAIGGTRTVRATIIAHRSGIGLTGIQWQNSELIARIRKLDSSVPIISNSRAAIYLLTGRIAYPFPTAMEAETARARPDYDQQMAIVEHKMQEQGAVLALFTPFAPAQTKVVEMDVKSRWGLRELAATPEGYLLGKAQPND